MRKLYLAAVVYVIAGLAAGLFYREFTKASAFPEGPSPSSDSCTPTCWPWACW